MSLTLLLPFQLHNLVNLFQTKRAFTNHFQTVCSVLECHLLTVLSVSFLCQTKVKSCQLELLTLVFRFHWTVLNSSVKHLSLVYNSTESSQLRLLFVCWGFAASSWHCGSGIWGRSAVVGRLWSADRQRAVTMVTSGTFDKFVWVTWHSGLQHSSHAELSMRKPVVQWSVAIHQKTRVTGHSGHSSSQGS